MRISPASKPYLASLVLFCLTTLIHLTTAVPDPNKWLQKFFLQDHEDNDNELQSFAKKNNLDKTDCQCKQVSSSRIVGGHTSAYYIPWILSLQLNGRHNCG